MDTKTRMPSRKRTNVRTSLGVNLARATFALLNRAAPSVAARCADRLFFTPPRARSRRVEAFLATGRPFTVAWPGGSIAAWRWGSGPSVLLVHGWGGRGGQLAAFVAPLVARGFSVVAFDAPGHGRSGWGRSSLVQFAGALGGVAEAAGSVHAVVAHSLGAAAVAFALSRGLKIRRAVFVGVSTQIERWTEGFAERFGVAPEIMAEMRSLSEARLGVRWSDLRILDLARGLDTELLLFHDRHDAEVPWSEGAALAAAWPGARMATTTGLGHRRALRDPAVVAQAVAFLTAGHEAAGEVGAESETRILEAELFDRDLRWQQQLREREAAS